MRVLHVHSGNLYGGVETLLVTLARHRGLCPSMEPHFALCFESRLSEELADAGVPVHLLGNVRVRRPATVWRSRRVLSDLLRRDKFDVAVCHSTWSQAIFGPLVRSAGIPLMFWLHGATDGRHWLDRWARMTSPDLALCNSQFTASTLSRIYPRVRAELVYYPVALPELNHSNGNRATVRAELDTPEDATVIIQVSRMEACKGHILHLEALGMLSDLPGWVCWQVGGAQRPQEVRYLETLKDSAARLGVAERVRFLGQRSDVPRLLAAADIYCQPNTGPEGLGIAFIEALFARLPVVTTAIGGAKEILDDSCGILVPPVDGEALAGSLRRLILDHTFRSHLGAAGPTRARKLCDLATQIGRIKEVLTQFCQQDVTG
jgi:glycosyltransferase involved in cell wall biosynthesis